jgi:hypothetical protein
LNAGASDARPNHVHNIFNTPAAFTAVALANVGAGAVPIRYQVPRARARGILSTRAEPCGWQPTIPGGAMTEMADR